MIWLNYVSILKMLLCNCMYLYVSACALYYVHIRIGFCTLNHQAMCVCVLCAHIFMFTYFMCMIVLFMCISLYHMCAWCLWRSEEGVGSLGTGVVDECELP